MPVGLINCMLLIHDVCTFIQIYFFILTYLIYIFYYTSCMYIYIYIYFFLTTCTSIVHHVCICMFFLVRFGDLYVDHVLFSV